MFSIEVSSSENRVIGSILHGKARIIIGDLEETLMLPLSYWSAGDYRAHWAKNLREYLLENKDKSFLITEMYDPRYANFIRWWVMYRIREFTCFQEKIHFLSSDAFDLESAQNLIPAYTNKNDEGEDISEWLIETEALESSPVLRAGG